MLPYVKTIKFGKTKKNYIRVIFEPRQWALPIYFAYYPCIKPSCCMGLHFLCIEICLAISGKETKL